MKTLQCCSTLGFYEEQRFFFTNGCKNYDTIFWQGKFLHGPEETHNKDLGFKDSSWTLTGTLNKGSYSIIEEYSTIF